MVCFHINFAVKTAKTVTKDVDAVFYRFDRLTKGKTNKERVDSFDWIDEQL